MTTLPPNFVELQAIWDNDLNKERRTIFRAVMGGNGEVRLNGRGIDTFCPWRGPKFVCTRAITQLIALGLVTRDPAGEAIPTKRGKQLAAVMGL